MPRDLHVVPDYLNFLHLLEFYWLFDPVVFDQMISWPGDWRLHYGTWYCNSPVFVLVAPSRMVIYSARSSKFCKTYDI